MKVNSQLTLISKFFALRPKLDMPMTSFTCWLSRSSASSSMALLNLFSLPDVDVPSPPPNVPKPRNTIWIMSHQFRIQCILKMLIWLSLHTAYDSRSRFIALIFRQIYFTKHKLRFIHGNYNILYADVMNTYAKLFYWPRTCRNVFNRLVHRCLPNQNIDAHEEYWKKNSY